MYKLLHLYCFAASIYIVCAETMKNAKVDPCMSRPSLVVPRFLGREGCSASETVECQQPKPYLLVVKQCIQVLVLQCGTNALVSTVLTGTVEHKGTKDGANANARPYINRIG